MSPEQLRRLAEKLERIPLPRMTEEPGEYVCHWMAHEMAKDLREIADEDDEP